MTKILDKDGKMVTQGAFFALLGQRDRAWDDVDRYKKALEEILENEISYNRGEAFSAHTARVALRKAT